MSIHFAGNYTILRAIPRALISLGMESFPRLDLEKLKADMAEAVARSSGRKFSKAASGGTNPDLYRNMINDGQDKRLSAEVFIGIVHALGKDATDYIEGIEKPARLPSASVLTSTLAILLDSVGVDPYEDERAQKLASRFPNVLQQVSALRAAQPEGEDLSPDEALPDRAEDQPSA